MSQQKQEEGWETTHYTSRFRKKFQQKYFINAVEQLAAVMVIETFQTFVYANEFEVVLDHKALMTILREKRY